MRQYKNFKSKQQYKEYTFEFDKKIKLIDNLNSTYNTKYLSRIRGASLNSTIDFYYGSVPFTLSNHDTEILSIDDFEKFDLYVKTLSKIEDFITKNKAKLFDLGIRCYNVHLSKNMQIIQRLIDESI